MDIASDDDQGFRSQEEKTFEMPCTGDAKITNDGCLSDAGLAGVSTIAP